MFRKVLHIIKFTKQKKGYANEQDLF